MFNKVSHILFPAIKIYGLSANLHEALFSLITTMEINAVALTYTIAVEGLFIFLKTSNFDVPEWMEAMEELF
ncbi:hypothetical protein [Robiginitalea aurantiaca]|uniref:Uncharacterized protein n=1 Tax=Robiginitalea aurantiaca TaxID=3056915 RepID=A0ABT7WBH6_9FLAO|nr:hypothetical protein [Robiginitalea aurantiaca]MDM9630275.1 hypothetical protein [Robiginitalea aurantiaca]